MLGDKRVMTGIPVKDVDEARAFYEGVLGLRFVGGPRADGSLEYECGAGTGLFTYPTEENAGRSPATLAAWQVDEIEATATQLREKDVVLEEYDMPGLKTEAGIATLPGARALWFKDPDGNILNVFERGRTATTAGTSGVADAPIAESTAGPATRPAIRSWSRRWRRQQRPAGRQARRP